MAEHRPRPEYLSVRSHETLDPLVAARKSIGSRVYVQTKAVRRTDGKLTKLFEFSGYCLL